MRNDCNFNFSIGFHLNCCSAIIKTGIKLKLIQCLLSELFVAIHIWPDEKVHVSSQVSDVMKCTYPSNEEKVVLQDEPDSPHSLAHYRCRLFSSASGKCRTSFVLFFLLLTADCEENTGSEPDWLTCNWSRTKGWNPRWARYEC